MKTRQLDSIQDFVDAWRQWEGRPADIASTLTMISRLGDAGYYSVQAGHRAHASWPDMHAWCCERIGARHYTWTGGTFWFDTEEAAVLFALTWA